MTKLNAYYWGIAQHLDVAMASVPNAQSAAIIFDNSVASFAETIGNRIRALGGVEEAVQHIVEADPQYDVRELRRLFEDCLKRAK